MKGSNIKKILLIRPELMGDTILLTPIVSAIKNKYPQAQIFMLLQAPMQEVIKNNPEISGCILCPPPLKIKLKEYLSLIKKIKQEKFDVSIVLEDNPRPNLALLPFLAGIKQRLGDKSRLLYGWAYNNGVWLDSADSKPHHIELYFKLLKPLGIEGQPPPLKLITETTNINIPDNSIGLCWLAGLV